MAKGDIGQRKRRGALQILGCVAWGRSARHSRSDSLSSLVVNCGIALGIVAMLQLGVGGNYLSEIVAALCSMGLGIVALSLTGRDERWLVAASPLLSACLAMLMLLACWHLFRVDRQFDTTASNLEVSLRIGLTSVFITGMALTRRRGALEVLCPGLVVMGAVWTGTQLADWIANGGQLSPTTPIQSARPARFVGTLGNPNVLGCALAMLFAMTLAELCSLAAPPSQLHRRHWAIGAGLLVCLQILLAGLLASQSRMSLICAAIAAVGLIVWRRRDLAGISAQYPAAMGILGLVCLVQVVVLWHAMGDRIVPRLARLSDDLAGRVELLEYGLRLSMQGPLLGSGLGTFRGVNEASLSSQVAGHFWNLGAVHNLVLGAAIEGGWIYVALGLFACCSFLRLLIRRSRVRSFTVREGGMLTAVLIGIVCAMFDIAMDFYGVAALEALLLGVLTGRASQVVVHDGTGHGLQAANKSHG